MYLHVCTGQIKCNQCQELDRNRELRLREALERNRQPHSPWPWPQPLQADDTPELREIRDLLKEIRDLLKGGAR